MRSSLRPAPRRGCPSSDAAVRDLRPRRAAAAAGGGGAPHLQLPLPARALLRERLRRHRRAVGGAAAPHAPTRFTGAPGPNSPTLKKCSSRDAVAAYAREWVPYHRARRASPRDGRADRQVCALGASAHSWYKHVPLQEAAVFSIVLELAVAMKRTPDGSFVEQARAVPPALRHRARPARAPRLPPPPPPRSPPAPRPSLRSTTASRGRTTRGCRRARTATPSASSRTATRCPPSSPRSPRARARSACRRSTAVACGCPPTWSSWGGPVTAACHGRAEAYEIYHHPYAAYARARSSGTLGDLSSAAADARRRHSYLTSTRASSSSTSARCRPRCWPTSRRSTSSS